MKNSFNLKDGEGWVFDLVDTLVCLVFTPYVILRHLWHLWCVLLSTLAVLLSSVINVLLGTEYPQYVRFEYDDPNHPMYLDIPSWYVWFTACVHNHIVTFHKWLVALISNNFDDGDDDDDFDGGEPQEVGLDEHEELKNPV